MAAQFKNVEVFNVWVAFERDSVISGQVMSAIAKWGGMFFISQDVHTTDNGVTSVLFIYQFTRLSSAEQFIERVRKLVEPRLKLDPDFELTMEWEPKTIRVPVLIRQ